MVPNRELAMQVADEARRFHYEMPMKVFQLYSGQSHRVETNKLRDGVDILTSTMDRLQWRRDGEKAFLSQVNQLVIDELDSFLEAGQEDQLSRLIE